MVSGYDYYLSVSLFLYDDREIVKDNYSENSSVHWSVNTSAQVLYVMAAHDTVIVSLQELADNVLRSESKNGQVSHEASMTCEKQSGKMHVKMFIGNISLAQTNSGIKIENLEAVILVKMMK
jgi:hypothetical protein